MVKIQATKTGYIISIPKEKVDRRGWGKGTIIDFTEYPNGDLVLKEVKQSPPSKTGEDIIA